MKKHLLKSLSEQNLIDCSYNHGTYGCNGGDPAAAFRYVKGSQGIIQDSDYPYKARVEMCKYKYNYDSKNYVSINGYKSIEKSEDALQEAVAKDGPVSVCIDASRYSFQFYSSGVYDEPSCSSTNLDHAVAAVGYGNLNGKDYWIVKNSWGTSWGQQGYILMSRNKNNQCGIASYAFVPSV